MTRSRSLVFASLLVLAGCNDQILHSDLEEMEANRMVALLQSAGLSAEKTRASDGQYAVSTARDEFSSAVELLDANGLPGKHYDSLGEVFAKEGFVSSPLEERARLNHALSQEIAQTLSNIDGVVMARVHLAVPARDELRDLQEPASASVFVKHRANVDLTGSVSQIKALVINGIENLPYDNVTVALFSTERARARTVTEPSVDTRKFAGMPFSGSAKPSIGALLVLGLLGLAGILGTGLAFVRRRRAD